jgi:mannosyl-3-phosphoglycerate phosphatase
MKLLIYTDLDGSLLDHETYSFRESKPALDIIRERKIPLIYVTSKTRTEVEQLQIEMGISDPFIVENGAAVYFPIDYMGFSINHGSRQQGYTVIRLGAEYAGIRRFVESVKDRFKIRGFGDMEPGYISKAAGLSEAQAIMAKQREFTEPFVIEDESLMSKLVDMAESEGFKITRGGRFFHLTGNSQDKGRAIEITTEIYSGNTDDKFISIGIGDSPNDISMLKRVNIPVLIPHTDGSYEDLHINHLRRALLPGSKGWNQIMIEILSHTFQEQLYE